MYNDIHFQLALLKYHEGDEVSAFRWLFKPVNYLNHRTPLEVISDGGRERVMGYLLALIESKENSNG